MNIHICKRSHPCCVEKHALRASLHRTRAALAVARKALRGMKPEVSDALDFRNRGYGHEVRVGDDWILVGSLVTELSALRAEREEAVGLLREVRPLLAASLYYIREPKSPRSEIHNAIDSIDALLHPPAPGAEGESGGKGS